MKILLHGALGFAISALEVFQNFYDKPFPWKVQNSHPSRYATALNEELILQVDQPGSSRSAARISIQT